MTPLDFLVIVLSALTLHRIWSYENITAGLRKWIDKIPYIRKPTLCKACSAFWMGGISVALWYLAPFEVSATLAAFMPARVLIWVYARMAVPATTTTTTAVVTQPIKPGSVVSVPGGQSAPHVPWTGTTEILYQRNVIIMTALGDFNPSYSVASAVVDQARAIALANPNWGVQVWVMVNADSTGWDMPENVSLRKVIPTMPWIENITSKEKSVELRDALLALLAPYKGTTIITHDLMFVTWYTLFAHAIHLVGATGGHQWFHIPHSLPSDRAGKSPYITTMPEGNHRVVCVARGYEQKYAEYYQIPVERVSRIPNIRDPRSWGMMTARVRQIITKTKLWSYDFVQVYPICTTRLEAKGFSKVVRTMALLNNGGNHAFLLICNPNAGGQKGVEIITWAKARAKELGLRDDCWAFTSDLASDSATYGMTADEVKALLYGYANLTLFPTMSEADSLLLREAQLAGCFIVNNSDVSTLGEQEDADVFVHWGTGTDVDDKVCAFAANRVLMSGPRDRLRRLALRSRNLEGIGHQWGNLITGAGPLPA